MHIHTHFSKHPTSLIILMVTFPQVHSLTHSLTHTQYHTLTLTNSLILSVSLYVSFTDKHSHADVIQSKVLHTHTKSLGFFYLS